MKQNIANFIFQAGFAMLFVGILFYYIGWKLKSISNNLPKDNKSDDEKT